MFRFAGLGLGLPGPMGEGEAAAKHPGCLYRSSGLPRKCLHRATSLGLLPNYFPTLEWPLLLGKEKKPKKTNTTNFCTLVVSPDCRDSPWRNCLSKPNVSTIQCSNTYKMLHRDFKQQSIVSETFPSRCGLSCLQQKNTLLFYGSQNTSENRVGIFLKVLSILRG